MQGLFALARRVAIAAGVALALTAPTGVAFAADPAPGYYPSGPQLNVPVSTVTDGDWTECYRDTYADDLHASLPQVLSSCTGKYLMLAGRSTGSDTLSLLAAAPRDDVLYETGENDSVTHPANGSEWYFHDGYSWGYAGAGQSVYKFQCDVAEGALRLCWHLIPGVGGYRIGNNAGLNGDSGYERIVYQSDGGPTGPRAQSISFTSTAPTNAQIGDTYTVSATGGGSGNPVTFSIDSSSTAGACTIADAKVTFTGVGTCVIDADQAGNDNYTAAEQKQQSVTVSKRSQTITFTTKAPKGAQPDSDYTVKATGGGSGNPVTFSTTSSTCTVTPAGKVHFVSGGDCVIAADQAGNDTYSAAPTATQTATVKARAQKIKFVTPPPTKAVKGTQAVIKATGGGSTNPVVFSVDQARSTAGACTVGNPQQTGGAYSATVSFTGPGKCIIDADQAGSAAFSPAPQVRKTTTVTRS